eukprot:756207-Hanusia_phi.AAC.3
MNIPDLYLVTELVVGGSLEDLLHVEKRRLSGTEILSISMQISDAMQFLHMANIVHRDLKPSNCLVRCLCCLCSPLLASLSRQIDHHGVVKLCDFGLARVLGREMSRNSESRRAGTPVYLAPEALAGAPTTNKVDIYSPSASTPEVVRQLRHHLLGDAHRGASLVRARLHAHGDHRAAGPGQADHPSRHDSGVEGAHRDVLGAGSC